MTAAEATARMLARALVYARAHPDEPKCAEFLAAWSELEDAIAELKEQHPDDFP